MPRLPSPGGSPRIGRCRRRCQRRHTDRSFRDHSSRAGRVFHALFENDEWCTVTRTPNTGYLRAVSGDPNKLTIGYNEGELPARFGCSDAQVHVWAGYDEKWDGGKNHDWWATLDPIRHVDFAMRTINLEHRTFWDLHAVNRIAGISSARRGPRPRRMGPNPHHRAGASRMRLRVRLRSAQFCADGLCGSRAAQGTVGSSGSLRVLDIPEA